MYIKKQRLLTPGTTPLYPPALHAMMRADIHHRTEDFRGIYRACLADLKEVMGTSNDVLMFAASGTGAMDAAVSNLFSKGDKVIVCVAGKFGERWAEMTKAYGLEADVITVPYVKVVSPEQVWEALQREPAAKADFVLALAQALKYVKQIGMSKLVENAQLLAKATRAAAGKLGLELFAAESPGAALTALKSPAGMDSGVIVKEFRSRFGAVIANGQGSM